MNQRYIKFVEGLRKFFASKDVKDDEDYIYVLSKKENEEDENEKIFFKISKEEVTEVLKRIEDDGMEFSEGILLNENYYELPVECQNGLMPFRYFEEDRFIVNEHGMWISISLANVDYCVQYICTCAEKKGDLELNRPLASFARISREKAIDLKEFCSGLRCFTVKVKTNKEFSIKQVKKYVNSYLFNVAYMSNSVFILKKDMFEDKGYRHRSKRTGQLFPYKHYNQELLKYYYQGTSASVPFSQYLAYYHVAEFYFQSISEQDAYMEIKEFITRPSFSPHSMEEVKAFYEKIKKKMRSQREDGVWDEKTGLLLTLKKYVPDLEQLKRNLQSLDINCIDYYKNNKAEEFTNDGKKIDFDNESETLYKNIRDRVYAVRNSIVHSKEGEKLRYEPFKHDKELAKEIPLIRAIAEEIIINSAKNIE